MNKDKKHDINIQDYNNNNGQMYCNLEENWMDQNEVKVDEYWFKDNEILKSVNSDHSTELISSAKIDDSISDPNFHSTPVR